MATTVRHWTEKISFQISWPRQNLFIPPRIFSIVIGKPYSDLEEKLLFNSISFQFSITLFNFFHFDTRMVQSILDMMIGFTLAAELHWCQSAQKLYLRHGTACSLHQFKCFESCGASPQCAMQYGWRIPGVRKHLRNIRESRKTHLPVLQQVQIWAAP